MNSFSGTVNLTLVLVALLSHGGFSRGIAQPTNSPIVIPATMVAESGVMVQVRVGGLGPYSFLIDSGAANSYLVDVRVARKLGCALNDSSQGSGAGEGTYPLYRCGKQLLQIGALTIADAEIVAIDMRPVWNALGRRIEGVIGRDLFRQHAVAIDFLAGTVTISAPAQFRPPLSAVELPLRANGGLMLTQGALSIEKNRSIPATFLIDTGAIGVDMFLNAPFATTQVRGTSSAGMRTRYRTVAGNTRFVMRRLAQLRLGPLLLDGPVGDISLDRKGVLAAGQWDAVLGGGVLRRFTVTFDLPHSRLFLEPNSEFTNHLPLIAAVSCFARQVVCFQSTS